MTIDEFLPKHEKKADDGLSLSDFMPKKVTLAAENSKEVEEESDDSASESAPVNLQKRNYDLDATRFGDWEINGRCVDF